MSEPSATSPDEYSEDLPVDPQIAEELESGGQTRAILLLAQRVHDLKKEVAVLVGHLRLEMEDLVSLDYLEERGEGLAKSLRSFQIVVAIVLVFVMGYFVVALKQESDARALHACQDRNELRTVMLDFVSQQRQIVAPEGASPDLVAVIANANKEMIEFRTRALKRLTLESCK